MLAEHDGITTRIGQVVILLHGGDREEARNRFAALWEEIGDDGSPLHRCTLAHYMADTQDDPEAELAWDLVALRAADAAGHDDEAAAGYRWPGVGRTLRGLYPALHLNLAADYHRLGEHQLARGHLGRARATATCLGDDEYGDGIRAGIARMGQRLPHEPTTD